MTARGRFVTLEGGEGAGKSTQLRLLADALRAAGLEVVATREPGGSPGAEQIRELLVNGAVGRWDAVTEALLHFAARRDHLTKTVWPALDRGSWVVSDRFADSTRAYQGYGHGLDLDMIDRLYAVTVGDFAPDLTIVLDLPVEAGLRRAADRAGGEDRYEKMDLGFHRRLRDGFLAIARAAPERCLVVDADRPVAEVQRSIRIAIGERLGAPLDAEAGL
ncbi:MAG: thymidylate kinase [Alphaproteobacteria bacterium]|nr:MAG: thymidylate kinase [Alphaproteobacteria bacterium]